MKKLQNTDVGINMLNQTVELYGWVSKKRDLGGLIFVDLRDRSGIIQLAFRPGNECYEMALDLKNEYVIKVIGTVVERESKNLNLLTLNQQYLDYS